MGNIIEEGREKLAEREKIKESSREIFTTAIDLLKTNGQPVKNLLFFKHQVVQCTMNSRKPEVYVEIEAGGDLKTARKISMYVGGVGRLDVIKTGVKGQERFRGRQVREYSLSGTREDLNGSLHYHINIVQGYLSAIKQVRSEIRPH